MNNRKSNFELLRIIAMIFIIIYHVIVHGRVIENSTNETFKTIIEIILFTIIIHVNLYVLLTGYFQIEKKFNSKKVWEITNASLFYKITIMMLLIMIGLIKVDKVTILKELSPINIDDYWFIKNYLFLYCISPFINKLVKNITKKEYETMLFTLTIMFSILPYLTGTKAFNNNGFTLYNFIYLYLIGGYIKLYNIKNNYIFKKINDEKYKLILITLFILCIIMNFSIYTTTNQLRNHGEISKEIFGNIHVMSKLYSNPIIILQSTLFFLYFETLNFKNKATNYVAKLVFGIYLIHDNIFLTKYIYKWLKIDNGPIKTYFFILNILAAAVIIFVISGVIETIRQKIFKFIYNRKISKKLREKYKSYTNRLLTR